MKLVPIAKPVRISIDCYRGIEHVSLDTIKKYFFIPDIKRHLEDGSLRRFLDQHNKSLPEDADIYKVADLLFETEGYITDEKSMLKWWLDHKDFENNLILFRELLEDRWSANALEDNVTILADFKEPGLAEFAVDFLIKRAHNDAIHAEVFLLAASKLGDEEDQIWIKKIEEERKKIEEERKKIEEEIKKIEEEEEKRKIEEEENRKIEEERVRHEQNKVEIKDSIKNVKAEFSKMEQMIQRWYGYSDSFDRIYDWPVRIDSKHFEIFLCYLLYILASGSEDPTKMKTLYNAIPWRIFNKHQDPSQMTKNELAEIIKTELEASSLLPAHLKDDARRLVKGVKTLPNELDRFFEYVIEIW